MEKELLFSITKDDFVWSFTKGSGAGGQKRNKTSSAVHCFHEASGAHGYSEDGRSQIHNRRDAFKKCIETEKFKKWHKIECAKHLGIITDIESEVEKMMRPTNLKIEGRIGGKWVPIEETENEQKEEKCK